MHQMVLKKHITNINRNVSKMMGIEVHGMHIVPFPKVEIISLEFMWLIVLRSAIKMHSQMHQVLEMCLLLPKRHFFLTFTCLV